MTKIEELTLTLDSTLREMRELGKEGLAEALKEVVSGLPEGVKSIGWRQYTNYFNDGEACTFSVHADATCMTTNGIHNDDLEAEDPQVYSQLFLPTGRGWDEAIPQLQKVSDFLCHKEAFLEQALGDHIRATYTLPSSDHPNGHVTVDHCDHD